MACKCNLASADLQAGLNGQELRHSLLRVVIELWRLFSLDPVFAGRTVGQGAVCQLSSHRVL